MRVITHRQLAAACDKIQKNRIGGHRKAMTRYEKDLLSEIEGLPESVQAKLLKVVHFVAEAGTQVYISQQV